MREDASQKGNADLLSAPPSSNKPHIGSEIKHDSDSDDETAITDDMTMDDSDDE